MMSQRQVVEGHAVRGCEGSDAVIHSVLVSRGAGAGQGKGRGRGRGGGRG